MCDDVACLTNNFISAPPNCGMMKSRSFCFEVMASFQNFDNFLFFGDQKDLSIMFFYLILEVLQRLCF
jgi:hypothetical protein